MHSTTTPDDEERLRQRQEITQQWIQQIPKSYPQLLTKTYFVPPVHVNKMALTELQQPQLASQKCTKDSDFRADRAQLMVERVFWQLAKDRQEKDVMVVLSNFSLDHYLNKTPSGTFCRRKNRGRKKGKAGETKVNVLFPTPEPPQARGEFDLLIVHKEYGFLIVEIKAIGDIQECEDGTLLSLEDILGNEEVVQALHQLNTRQDQLEIITSDLPMPRIPVTKIAAFPHVTRDKLREVMKSPKYSSCLSDELTKYLGTEPDLDNALKFWLCEDEVKGIVTSEGATDDIRMTWWEGLMDKMKTAGTAGFRGIEDDVYKQLTGRLCGPMSTVEVWRHGSQIHEARDLADATHVMSTWCKRWILRPKQLKWFHSRDRFVYLTGPPGSGKTLLLVVNAAERVKQNNTMVVVVRGPGNLPGHLISQVLHSQILTALKDENLPSVKNQVLLETIDAWTDPQEFVRRMKDKAQAMEAENVLLLVDELWLANPSSKMLNLLQEMTEVLETCRNDVEASFGSSADCSAAVSSIAIQKPCTAEEKISKPSTASSSVMESAGSQRAIQERVNAGSRIVQALQDVEQKIEKLHTVHKIAKVVLTQDVEEKKRKLLSVAGKMQEFLTKKGPSPHSNEPDVSAQVLEKVLDVEFFAEVLTSWMASPVLHNVMQKVRDDNDVSLWCTGFWPNRCPDGYTQGFLSESIRCPCHIQELLEQTEHLASHQETKQYEYYSTSTQANPPMPAEASPFSMLTPINHGSHVQPGDAMTCVSHCTQCAEELASLLLKSLRVGEEKESIIPGPGSRLDFRDVLIVGRALLPIKPDSAFVRTLEARGIPTSVVVNGSGDLLPDQDQDGGLFGNTVLITNTYNGHGLERSVVVFVPDIKHCRWDGGSGDDGGNGGGGGGGFMESLGQVNEMGIWFIASRSLGHLVVFHV